MEQETQTPHKRRVRYKGKYPRKFEEKYKELNPEKYKDTIEHVISKGNTPAGMHISIMVNEILDFLKIQPGETGFDATLGYGGHTKAMMECLHGEGHMYATDVDPEEQPSDWTRLAAMSLPECCMRTLMSHTARKLLRQSQMRSAKETVWILLRNYVRS